MLATSSPVPRNMCSKERSEPLTFDTAVPAERAFLVCLEQQGNALEADDSLVVGPGEACGPRAHLICDA